MSSGSSMEEERVASNGEKGRGSGGWWDGDCVRKRG